MSLAKDSLAVWQQSAARQSTSRAERMQFVYYMMCSDSSGLVLYTTLGKLLLE